MKYTPLREKDIKIKHIEPPSTGIVTENRLSKNETKLTFAKNVIYRDGFLSTRKGLNTNLENFLDFSMAENAQGYNYTLTDYEISIEGEPYKIARADALCDDSAYFVFVYGIDKNQNVKSLGYMIFNRVEASAFYCPENIVFYSGKSQNGGIFAMVTLKNIENPSEMEYAVYEADSSYTVWNYASEYYIPTVLINGRGNAYDTLDWSFNTKPQMPEKRNLLDGNFYAYYSSDGASYSFRLPFTDIDNSAIKCRIYQSATNFTEWTIYEDEVSAKKTFLEKEVTISVDRAKGIVYFSTDDGALSIPVIGSYNENNIRIMASKKIENGFKSVLSCKCAVKYGDKTLFSGSDNGSEIFYADYETPLYFPQVFDNEIGMPNEAVTALKSVADKVIAFKANEAYEISVKNGGNFNTVALLADNGTLFKNTDSFTVKKLSGDLSFKSESIAVVEGNIMGLTDNGDIYLLKKGAFNPQKLEIKAKSILKELMGQDTIYTAGVGENYILCSNYKAIIININGSCYYWEFPKETDFEGVASIGDSVLFMYRYNNSKRCYIAGIDGENDVLISDEATTFRFPIETELTLNYSDSENISSKKSIKSVDLNLECNGNCKLTVGDSKVYATAFVEQPKQLGDSVKFITDITGVKALELNICGDSCITFGGADIYYTV